MIRLQSIRRALADSPLVGVLLVLGSAGALGCTLATANHLSLAEHSDHWVAPPSAPCPPSFRAAEEPKLVRESFHPYSPAAQLSVRARARARVRKNLDCDEQHRATLRDFGPLYRRPPPSFS